MAGWSAMLLALVLGLLALAWCRRRVRRRGRGADRRGRRAEAVAACAQARCILPWGRSASDRRHLPFLDSASTMIGKPVHHPPRRYAPGTR